MAESYILTLKNATDQPWHFGVYQKSPTSPGLTSVAWQIRGIPPKQGGTPASAQVNWTMSYGLCIADFDEDQQRFSGSQMASAYVGNKYKVESLDGIPSIDTKPTGTGSPDQITLRNATSSPVTPLTMGFTLSGNILCVERDVGGLQETIYRVHPTYYVACYRNIVLGQMVDEGVAIGPVEVKYDGVHQMTVEASKDIAGNYHINVLPS